MWSLLLQFKIENLSMCKRSDVKLRGIGGRAGGRVRVGERGREVCSIFIGTSFFSSSIAKFSVLKAEL